jgi:hypothetical protein
MEKDKKSTSLTLCGPAPDDLTDTYPVLSSAGGDA